MLLYFIVYIMKAPLPSPSRTTARGRTQHRDVKRKAEAKIVDMEEKIRDLQRMRVALVSLVVSCKEEGPSSECPILEALDTRGEG
jgi:hypothetical protein